MRVYVYIHRLYTVYKKWLFQDHRITQCALHHCTKHLTYTFLKVCSGCNVICRGDQHPPPNLAVGLLETALFPKHSIVSMLNFFLGICNKYPFGKMSFSWAAWSAIFVLDCTAEARQDAVTVTKKFNIILNFILFTDLLYLLFYYLHGHILRVF